MQDEILKEFIVESKTIVQEALVILGLVNENLDLYRELGKYSNSIDRIMGGAATIAIDLSKDHPLHLVASYSSGCKELSNKLSQAPLNKELLKSCLSVLLEVTEAIDKLIRSLHLSPKEISSVIPQNLQLRLKQLSDQFCIPN